MLEFFASLRSPYTYIATERVLALAQRTGAELALRPVLPMVMRGLPVPPAKQLYIALDTKREAEDAGVAFGRICDPVGRPVERCFSLYPLARERGRGSALLLEFMRAAWSQGVDTGTDAGLRHAVERAGISWSEAHAHLDRDEGWRAELEANRSEMFAHRLWGLPSFRVRDLVYFSELVEVQGLDYAHKAAAEGIVPLGVAGLRAQRLAITARLAPADPARPPRVSSYDLHEFVY